ncbi:MAG: GtrA family protein [Actinomycetota bacterium]
MRAEEAVQHGAAGAARVFRLPDPRRATRADWTQLLRFCAVGLSGYVVNLAVFSTLVTVGDAHYATAAAVAFCIAWLNNFVLNRSWTFKRGRILTVWAQAARYLLISLLALGLNLAVLHLLVQAGTPEVPAQALAIIAVTPVSFLLTRRWALR